MNVGTIILAALSAIEALLPLLTGAGVQQTSAVGKIITMLQQFMPLLEKLVPLIGDEVSLIYQGIKNIVGNLRGDSVTTTVQQDADLDSLDARVDQLWNKYAPQFDPDYVAPGPAGA